MVHLHQPVTQSSDPFHEYQHVHQGRLGFVIVINAVVMIVEIIGGLMTNSMALITDAGHMFTHVFALCLSFAAILCTSIKACHHRTFGFYRAEVLAALFNSIILFAVTAVIVWESILRIMKPREILSSQMLVVALIGLAVNIASIALLWRKEHHTDRNVKSAVLHMVSDTASSIVIVIGAIIIAYTGWFIIDPLLSIGIALLIIIWAWDLLKDSINVLLETVPEGIKTDEVSDTLKREIPEIEAIEDIHIWEITTHMYSMTAHVVIDDMLLSKINAIQEKINTLLYKNYNIGHATIQFRNK